MPDRLAQLQAAVAAHFGCSLNEILQLDRMTQLRLMVEAGLISNTSMELLAHCPALVPLQSQQPFKTPLASTQSQGLPDAFWTCLRQEDSLSRLQPTQSPASNGILDIEPSLAGEFPSLFLPFDDPSLSTSYHGFSSFQGPTPSQTTSYSCPIRAGSTFEAPIPGQAYDSTSMRAYTQPQPISPALTVTPSYVPQTLPDAINSNSWNQDGSCPGSLPTLAYSDDVSGQTISTTAIGLACTTAASYWSQPESVVERCSVDPFATSSGDIDDQLRIGSYWDQKQPDRQNANMSNHDIRKRATSTDTSNYCVLLHDQAHQASSFQGGIMTCSTSSTRQDLLAASASNVANAVHHQSQPACKCVDDVTENSEAPSLSQRAGSSPQRKRRTGRRTSAEIDCNERRRVANMSPTRLQHVRQLAREAARRRKYKERQSMKQLQHALVGLEVEQRGLRAELRTLEGEWHRLYQYVVQQRSRPGTKSSNLHTYI
eukprot:m.22695 g.22695  ORF g.22695 m.22695 type:complete len:485 (+) comp11284_c0_seq3:148-1602(+)